MTDQTPTPTPYMLIFRSGYVAKVQSKLLTGDGARTVFDGLNDLSDHLRTRVTYYPSVGAVDLESKDTSLLLISARTFHELFKHYNGAKKLASDFLMLPVILNTPAHVFHPDWDVVVANRTPLRTRDGRKAFVLHVNNDKVYPLLGCVAMYNDVFMASWRCDGVFHTNSSDDDCDLVGFWEDN